MPKPQQGTVSEGSLAERRATVDMAYWLRVRREARVEGIKCSEEAAKQAVMIASLLQGLYFAAVSFSDIKKVGSLGDIWFVIFAALSVVIIGIWMASLYFATRVLAPCTYQSGTEDNDLAEEAQITRDTYEKILNHKHGNLRWAYVLLWASFLPLAANLTIYLVLLPALPTTSSASFTSPIIGPSVP